MRWASLIITGLWIGATADHLAHAEWTEAVIGVGLSLFGIVLTGILFAEKRVDEKTRNLIPPQ